MRLLIIFIIFITVLKFIVSPALAFDVMSTYTVTDKQAVSGDILSNIPGKGLYRSDKSYDTQMFGVLITDPEAVFRNVNDSALSKPVATEGSVVVNVTDFNGAINQGDPITSSPIGGKGMKALVGGFIIGFATSTTTPAGKVTYQGKSYQNGLVNVTLRIGYYDSTVSTSSQTLFRSVAADLLKNAQDPEKFAVVMRYIIAGILSILAFVFGLFAFSRSIIKGIEAIGRNPLAKTSIQMAIILQVIFTLIVTFGAIILAFLILRA